MKIVIRNLVSLIVICAFFSSCSSKFSLTKRHYRSGYFVSNSRKNSTSNDFKKLKIDKPRTISLSQSIDVARVGINNDNLINNESILQSTTSNGYSSINESTIKTPRISKYKVHAIPLQSNKINQKNKLQFRKGGIVKSTDAGRNHEGHSLLWIVIIIVLVLWALGYLAFSLGAFIHLLLLVALVLLILWLLRVI